MDIWYTYRWAYSPSPRTVSHSHHLRPTRTRTLLASTKKFKYRPLQYQMLLHSTLAHVCPHSHTHSLRQLHHDATAFSWSLTLVFVFRVLLLLLFLFFYFY